MISQLGGVDSALHSATHGFEVQAVWFSSAALACWPRRGTDRRALVGPGSPVAGLRARQGS